MSTDQLTGLQMAIALLAQIGDDDSDRAIAAVHDLADEHAQRLTLQHHAADQVWRIADLEVKCVTLKELHDAATDERDALRAKYDELLVALHGIGAALGIPEGDRSPYSVTCGVLERVNRLAEIEAQEPVAISKAGNLFWAGNPQDWRGVDCSLYATHVPAQAVPDADGARFRWLCEDHSDRETRERCRSLIDRLPVMSYSDAVMSIDAAMAAAPEHKA